MKRFSRIIFSLLVITSTSLVEAATPTETEYHCPSIQDIKYERGQFTASTNYNGVEMNWYDITLFPEKSVPVNGFLYASGASDCIGGLCSIECNYKVESKRSDTIRLDVSYNAYQFSQPVAGNWIDSKCEAVNPEECTFMVAENHW